MTEGLTSARALALAAAPIIADNLSSSSDLNLLRDVTIKLVDVARSDNEPSAENLVDFEVTAELINRSLTNKTMRDRLDRYTFLTEDVGDINFDEVL